MIADKKMNYIEAIVLIIRERALLINSTNKYDSNMSYDLEEEIGKSVRSKSVNSKLSVSL
jgi:hypothetical protein